MALSIVQTPSSLYILNQPYVLDHYLNSPDLSATTTRKQYRWNHNLHQVVEDYQVDKMRNIVTNTTSDAQR